MLQSPYHQPSLYARAASARACALGALVALGLIAVATGVHAETPEAAEATPAAEAAPTMDSHYAAGKDALKAGDQTGALEHFKAALKLADADERGTWQMLLAIAVTYQRMDKPGFAVEYYQRFLKRSDEYRDALTVKWSKRRAMAETDIVTLEAKTKTTHGFVTVVSEPPGAAIFLGDVQAGADQDARTTKGMYLRAGTYEVTLKLDGYKEVTRTAEVAEGKLVALRFSLEPLVTTPKVAVGPADPAEAPQVAAKFTPEEDLNLGPWITIGSGGAVAIASVALGIVAAMARSDWEAWVDDYENTDSGASLGRASDEYAELKSKTEGYELAAYVTAGVAVAAAAGGVVWLLLGDEDEPSVSGAPTLLLLPTPEGASAHATWRF